MSRKLLLAFNTETAFVDAVAAELEAGRMKRKEAEKAIIGYFQDPYKLTEQLQSVLDI